LGDAHADAHVEWSKDKNVYPIHGGDLIEIIQGFLLFDLDDRESLFVRLFEVGFEILPEA
jgi:hypothetical protein